ncbi:hypothetical protein M407DRAFT_34123 [Tulasnella calospora MUT 4182]|uniref:Uncharacterized protein n=1 Tax=Tulasnella calospora MUT 4182 TaxID=1051891 RepID=A0A0C3PP40_9AGAM|nr:hypothetical protein M407DRAFT_34123 [Tulasnella calospora MUT 4182]
MSSAPPPEFPSQFFPSNRFNVNEAKASQAQDPVSIAIFFGGLALTALVLTKTVRAIQHLWPFIVQCTLQLVLLTLSDIAKKELISTAKTLTGNLLFDFVLLVIALFRILLVCCDAAFTLLGLKLGADSWFRSMRLSL